MKFLALGLAVSVAALIAVSASVAARPQIISAAELAFCNGQPVEPVHDVLALDSAHGCVLNLIVEGADGMAHAFVESSTDGGRTWEMAQIPVEFVPTPSGAQTGVAFTCDAGFPSGSYLYRARAFLSGTHGSAVSHPFPFSVTWDCG